MLFPARNTCSNSNSNWGYVVHPSPPASQQQLLRTAFSLEPLNKSARMLSLLPNQRRIATRRTSSGRFHSEAVDNLSRADVPQIQFKVQGAGSIRARRSRLPDDPAVEFPSSTRLNAQWQIASTGSTFRITTHRQPSERLEILG